MFPMPDVAVMPRDLPNGPEGESLLGRAGGQGRKTQQGLAAAEAGGGNAQTNSLLAGAEFELGDDNF